MPEKDRQHSMTLAEIIIGVVVLVVALALLGPRIWHTRQKRACQNNLRRIDSGKEQWALAERKTDGDPIVTREVNQYIRGNTTPICPAGGAYSYLNIGSDPTCSTKESHGHVIDWGY